jgi:methylmalonyl-CoA mutase
MSQMVKEKAAPVDFSEFAPPSYAEWKEEAAASLNGAPFDKKLLTRTYEGITLEPLYTAEHAAGFIAKSGLPGSGAYLRGTSAAGYSGQPWLIAQTGDRASPVEANALLLEGLGKGVTAICFSPGCPRLSGLDDMRALLNGIDLAKYPLQVFCGSSADPALGLLAACAEEKGMEPAALHGVFGADPLGMLAHEGENSNAMAGYYGQMASCLRRAAQNMPRLKTIFIQGSVYHEGGASAVQELAAVFAAAIAYLDALGEQGFSVDEIAAGMAFSFSLGSNFFMEIAKLRAARLVWAEIIKAYGGGEEAAKLDARAATSRFTAAAYDPHVNILRAATQAFSGVVGGVNALTVEPFDAAFRPCGEQSRRVARNIQVMMQNEFGLASPVDPAGGSWYVETLTGQVAEAAWGKLQEIEKAGGLLAALQKGVLQKAIAATLSERFAKLAVRADCAVGVNMYVNTEEKYPGVVERAGPSGDGLAPIAPRRWTEQFEALRAKTEEHRARTGKNITVFLANMGPQAQHKARADFSAGFMETGGFTVLRNSGFSGIAEAAEAAAASGAEAAVICSTDESYPAIVPELARAIKAKAPHTLVMLAGMPAPEFKDRFIEAGVDDFIHIRADCLCVLGKIQRAQEPKAGTE